MSASTKTILKHIVYMSFDTIVIRKELKQNEFRTPIVPKDVKVLVSHNFKVFIEHSPNRCYDTNEYINNGAMLIDHNEIYNLNKNSTLLIGLKDLDLDDEELFSFNHIYFSHTYKNQTGSEEILKMFKNKNGKIYDLEYITDKYSKRLVSFGYYAGFVGALLGVWQYLEKLNKKKLNNLQPIFNIKTKITEIKKCLEEHNLSNNNLKICVIGPNGRCGSGSLKLFDLLNLIPDKLGREHTKDNLHNYNIIINCIFLNKTDTIKPFISDDNISNFKDCVVIDVSCDCTSDNNPINIYTKPTSHEFPSLSYNNDQLHLIAIDNLPTLVPVGSSEYFSDKLVQLLIKINDQPNDIWDRCINMYFNKIQSIV